MPWWRCRQFPKSWFFCCPFLLGPLLSPLLHMHALLACFGLLLMILTGPLGHQEIPWSFLQCPLLVLSRHRLLVWVGSLCWPFQIPAGSRPAFGSLPRVHSLSYLSKSWFLIHGFLGLWDSILKVDSDKVSRMFLGPSSLSKKYPGLEVASCPFHMTALGPQS